MANKLRAALFAWIAFGFTTAYAAELRGQVKLSGPPPEQEKVNIEPKKGIRSTQGCGSRVKDSQKLLVGPSGGVKNAVVWLDIPDKQESADFELVLIDQKQCVFEPHVAAIPAGGRIAVRNSDSVIHNVRIFEESKPSALLHQWQKADAADIPWRFAQPGRFIVRCGVHPWMYAWVFVAPGSHAAVTDSAGCFTLAGVPEGRHTLHVWHETLGTREVPVPVGPKGAEMGPILLRRKPDAV